MHTIYDENDEPTEMVFDTIEEAELKLKECPEGYWIDTWYYDYLEDMRRRMLDSYLCD